MDKLIKSISLNGHFRAFVVEATEVVRTAQALHGTLPSSTVALGRTLLAALILAANEKGTTKITVKVLGDGQMGPLLAVADSATLSARGYVKNPQLDYRRASTNEVLVAPLIGNGSLVVIKDFGLRQPYSGQVDLVSGEIGADLAWYFLSSEQTPSSVGLSVHEDARPDSDTFGQVLSAQGFMLQAMPDATTDEIAQMEKGLETLRFDGNLQQLTAQIYGDMVYKSLSEDAVSWHCDCSKARFSAGIASLPTAEITAMIEENHGAEVVCQFCNTAYHFSEKELNALILEGLAHD
ncbi:MAG: Hsp33 family molecular chaperone HslO [Streptococcaceae bacterium]|jgi:molecular chaperone Hsp33|nr:Hsp33 family molecular chaperone HslO [Streptococcaceae bacterium]